MTFLFFFELIGTVAFAVSGAITAMKKGMDVFGVLSLSVITAVGGGVFRDLILGHTPPVTFQNPIYASVAAVSSLIVFIPGVTRIFYSHRNFYSALLLVMDSAGLGIFTVTGIEAAGREHGAFLLVFVGLVTGVGGGVIRDVLAGDRPYIFVKHIYALASIAGALLYLALGDSEFAMVIAASFVTAIRLLSARFGWSLPRAGDRGENEG